MAHEFIQTMQNVQACAAQWVKTFPGSLVLIFDPGCEASAKEKIQYIVYYNLYYVFGCMRYPLEFIFRAEFRPIANFFVQMYDLIGEIKACMFESLFFSPSK